MTAGFPATPVVMHASTTNVRACTRVPGSGRRSDVSDTTASPIRHRNSEPAVVAHRPGLVGPLIGDGGADRDRPRTDSIIPHRIARSRRLRHRTLASCPNGAAVFVTAQVRDGSRGRPRELHRGCRRAPRPRPDLGAQRIRDESIAIHLPDQGWVHGDIAIGHDDHVVLGLHERRPNPRAHSFRHLASPRRRYDRLRARTPDGRCRRLISY